MRAFPCLPLPHAHRLTLHSLLQEADTLQKGRCVLRALLLQVTLPGPWLQDVLSSILPDTPCRCGVIASSGHTNPRLGQRTTSRGQAHLAPHGLLMGCCSLDDCPFPSPAGLPRAALLVPRWHVLLWDERHRKQKRSRATDIVPLQRQEAPQEEASSPAPVNLQQFFMTLTPRDLRS